jgi:hypothetical protein
MTQRMLDDFDPYPMYGGANELRYLCPSDECKDYPADNTHRSLTIRTTDKVGQCFRCGLKGRLRDSVHAVPLMKRATRVAVKRTVRDVMR